MKKAEIIELIDGIDTVQCAREILTWLEKNVEYFIDNQNKKFEVNIILKTDSKDDPMFQELFKIDNLFKAYAKTTPISVELHKKIGWIYDKINEQEDLLASLFERMAFFYEIKGINQGKLIMDELDGSVRITSVQYDNFKMGVKSNDFVATIDGEQQTIEGSGDFSLDEGFAISLEISFSSTNKRDSLF
jgi:hypothetical protein